MILSLFALLPLAASLPATVHAQGSPLHYRRGYSLQSGWLCYGWSNGMYRCTHHWKRSTGRLISLNPRWVPNYGLAPSRRPSHHSSGHATHHASRAVPSGSVKNMILNTFGAAGPKALRVAMCESSLRPNAYNRSGASGVFQFLASTWRETPYRGYSRFNAWANIEAAHWLYLRDGHSWREWSCGGA